LMSQMCSRLSSTTSVWGKLVAPWAEYVAGALWTEAKHGSPDNSAFPTRLTQQRRTEAKGKVWTAEIEPPKSDHLCGGCGKTITKGSTHCAKCAIGSATERLINAARKGRIAGHTPEALAREAESQRRHAKARSDWKPASQPAWLSNQLYSETIQPVLTRMSASAIAKHIGVSRWYAGRVIRGYRPHPRHWQALASLAEIEPRTLNRPNGS
jgi:hypothetical protein